MQNVATYKLHTADATANKNRTAKRPVFYSNSICLFTVTAFDTDKLKFTVSALCTANRAEQFCQLQALSLISQLSLSACFLITVAYSAIIQLNTISSGQQC